MLPFLFARRNQAISWAFLLSCFFGWHATALSQEDLPDDLEKEKQPSANVFSKLFGTSTTKKPSSAAITKTEKPKVPAQTAAGKTSRGGLFVPLKSFTKAFRGPSESDLPVETEEPQPAMIAPRIPREPFRNLPRVQERRERSTNDLQVESTPTLPESALPAQTSRYTGSLDPSEKPIDNKSRAAELMPKSAPIVRADPSYRTNSPIPKPQNASRALSGTVKGTPEKKPEAGKTDFVIESSSTSRRSNLNIVETASPIASVAEGMQPTEVPARTKNPSTNLDTLPAITKRIDPPDNLLELGRSLQTSKTLKSPGPSPVAPDTHSGESKVELLDKAETTRSVPLPLPAFPDESQITKAHPPVSTVSKSTPTSNSHRAPDRDRMQIEIDKVSNDKPNTTTAKQDKNRVDSLALASKSLDRTFHEMSLPGVRVSIQGPDAMTINKECHYEIVAKNEGTEDLNGLAMRISVPHQVIVRPISATVGVTQPDNDQDGNALVWELDHIPAGGSQTAKLALLAAKPEHFGLGLEWTLLPQSKETQILVQQPQLALALEGPSEVEFGKPQMYRVRVRNAGNADVKAVSVALSAEPYGSNQSDIGDVVAGSERVIDVELTFQQAGRLPIKASASSSVSELAAESAIEVQVRQSDLTVQWRGPRDFYQGGIADYEIEVTNQGTIAALNTACKFVIPIGADVSGLPAGGVRKGDLVLWEIKRIEPQEKVIVPIKLTMHKMGDNKLSITTDCVTAGECKAEHLTTIDSIADLHLIVSDPIAPAPVGQPVTYEIAIVNRGKKAANNVEVVAQFSDGIEPIKMEGQTGSIVPGQAIFQPIPSIGPNEKKILKVIAEASKSGVHRFRAEVKCIGSDADLLEEESTRFIATGARADRR